MVAQQRSVIAILRSRLAASVFAWVIGLSAATMFIGIVPAAQSQTFQVLHSFSMTEDGFFPATGLVLDRAGNLYGTSQGGANGYGGVVFKLTHRGSSWTFTPLHNFVRTEGIVPAGLTIGPDGNLYGANAQGGGGMGCGTNGCGTVFKLNPPASFCASVDCAWPATVLYAFQGSNGYDPMAGVIFDQAGNLYGTTYSGGLGGYCCGVAFELSPASGTWTYNIIHSFGAPDDGAHPQAPLVFDNAGNLYGTTIQGGTAGLGSAFRMTPSPSGWNETVLWSFLGAPDGYYPIGEVVADPEGNVYGTTYRGGTSDNCEGPYCGAVFAVSPANGGWTESLLHSFDLSNGDADPQAGLTMDSAGNLDGTTSGYNTGGNVFKLTPTDGGWVYTSLHEFQYTDGEYPVSTVAIDADGNLYGTASGGGAYGYGVVWEITP
jgi:uncharacterized repeat protein (TIGR03803 family)